MQASKAPNETRLPRAVVRQSDAIKAKFGQREPKLDPAADALSAEAATTADPQMQAQTPNAQPVDPRHSDPAYWRQRFNVTSGVLNAERAERKAESQLLQRQVTELQEQVRSLQASQTSAAADIGAFFTPEQVEELGPEQAEAIVKAVKKTAQEAIEAEVKPLRDKQTRDQEEAAKDRRTQFLDQLAELVPNYQEIDSSDGWKLWLSEYDDDVDENRQATLTRRLQKADVRKVAKMFEAYQKTLPSVPTPPISPRGSAATPSGQPPAATAALTAPTTAEVKDFYVRAATKRKGQAGYVTDQERQTFEARMKLRGR